MNVYTEEPEINQLVDLLATNSNLLVVSDFDGTLSDFTENPAEAALDHFAHVALRQLSEFPNTTVAIISGRALKDLAGKFTDLDKVRLIGSHGHEYDLDKIIPLNKEQRESFSKAETEITKISERFSGSRVELKPHGVVFHYRGVTPPPPNETLDSLRVALLRLPHGIVRNGNNVVEYCVVETNKGDALVRLQEQVLPTITLFVGDDVTDEAAFQKMGGSDVSIKVGDGETSARYRLKSKEAVVYLLGQIANRREEWMKAASAVPVDQHLFISDQRTMGLIDNRGTVSWLCVPCLDGPPLFGSLIGGPGAGYFRISASGEAKQEYAANALMAKTKFNEIVITDFLDCSAGRTYQRAGRSDLIRLIEGSGTVEIEFAPKFNFGRVPTRLARIPEGLRVECGQQRMILLSPECTWDISREGNHDVARCNMTLKEARVSLVLMIGSGRAAPLSKAVSYMQVETQRFWDGWLATLKLPKVYPALAARSAIVLRGLSYGPSGAIAAAATSSLPGVVGSIRNWDYRYCWPRDACLAATSLLSLNALGPAMRLLDWLLEIVIDANEGEFLSPLYTVHGRKVPDEAEVHNAIGYCGSRPVRIGNLAAEQLQLDALGPIGELMCKLAARGATLTLEHLQLTEKLVTMITERWQDTDSGIWEIRGAQRHYVHSKLMCWYTINCCAAVSSYMGTEREDWLKLADEIRQQIERHGYDESLQSYVAAYNLQEADAALLWIILSGFHPPDHPRSKGTLEFLVKNLSHNKSVYRYHFDDTLHGKEGEFIICRSWLIEALVMTGDIKEARRLLDEMVSRMGPLGLLAEQWHENGYGAMGNYPQAYSHLGLINAICSVSSAENPNDGEK